MEINELIQLVKISALISILNLILAVILLYTGGNDEIKIMDLEEEMKLLKQELTEKERRQYK